MSEFTTADGQTLHLARMDRHETRRLVRQFDKACRRGRKQAMVEMFDRLFDHCAAAGVADDPPDDALDELGTMLGIKADRVAWLRFVVLMDEAECVGFVATALAGALGIDAAEVRDFRAGIERMGTSR